MASSLGELVAYIRSDTSGLKKGLQDADKSTKQFANSAESTITGVEKKLLSSFKAIGVGAAAALSVKAVGNYAAEWSRMSESVRHSAGDIDSATSVMAQLSSESIKTGSQLDGLARTYQRNSASLTALGKSTDDQIKLTRALNSAMVLSGATAQKQRQTLDNISRAITRGTINQSELNQVIRDGSVVADILGSELGKTTGELQQMARDGELTASMISDSLVKNMDELSDRAGEMATSVADGFNALKTSVMALIGETDDAVGATDSLGTALTKLAQAITPFDDTGNLKDWAQNLHLVKDAAVILAGIMAGRMVASVASSTAAMAASRVEAVRYQAALARMAGVSQTAATGIAAAGAAATAARSAFALLGGPAGIAITAATALVYFGGRAKDTVEPVDDLRAYVDELSGSLKNMNKEQAQAAFVKIQDRIDDTKEKLKEATLTLETLEARLAEVGGEGSKNWKELQDKIVKQRGLVADLAGDTSKLAAAQGEVYSQIHSISGAQEDSSKATSNNTDKIQEQIDALEKARATWGMTSNEIAIYELEQNGATDAQLAHARSLVGTIDALDKQSKALKEARDHVTQLSNAYQSGDIANDIKQDLDAIKSLSSDIDSVKDITAIINADYELNAEGYEQTLDDLNSVKERLESAVVPDDLSPEAAEQWQTIKEAQLQAIDDYASAVEQESERLTALRASAMEFTMDFDDQQDAKLQERVDNIRNAYEQQAITQQEYLDAMAAAEEEYNVAIMEHRQALRDNALEFTLTDEERFEEEHESRMERLREALEEEAITRDEYRAAEIASEKELKDSLAALDKQAMQEKISGIQTALSQASSLMNSENRKMFELGKVAAISSAVIDTASGVSKAWALGPIVGPPLAAMVAAAGAAQIATIKSTKFGSGSSSSPSAGASSSPKPEAPEQPEQSNDDGFSQNVYLHGIDPSQLYDGQQLIDIINQQIESGGRLVQA